MTNHYYSPLRYPGGKASLYDFLVRTLDHNEINYGVYVEGFAGGAGAALKLLMFENVGDIILNDKDIFVYKFWKAVLNDTEALNKMIVDTVPSIEEWGRRQEILNDNDLQGRISDLELAYTGFFLNRCNRSGIFKAGPIGGKEQKGKWKIDARFNKKALVERIEKIAYYRDRIQVYNWDILKFMRWLARQEYDQSEVLVYLDPPYVGQGKDLYREFFTEKDHKRLAAYLQKKMDFNWIVSYDDHPLIHQSYKEVIKNIFEFNYFANRTKVGRELVICSKEFLLPDSFSHYSRTKLISHGLERTRTGFKKAAGQ